MTILNANGKILKANGKVLVNGGSDIIFLTYFENFDLSTKIDTPVIGQPFQLATSTDPLYSKTTLHCMGTDVPALKVGASYYTNYSVTDSIVIPANIPKWSVEFFFYIPYSNNELGVGILFAPSAKGLVCDPKGWGGGTSGSFLGISDKRVYNGANMNGYGSNGHFIFPYNFDDRLCHGAYVLDAVTNTVRVYIDGVLYCSYVVEAGIEHTARPYINAKRYWEGTISQVAVFGYDKSINNGMNYPVPTQRYA